MPPRGPAADLPESVDGPHRSSDPFVRQVHRALAHLHDPAYLQVLPLQPAVPLAHSAQLGLHGSSLGRSLQQSLLQAVDFLRPSRSAPVRSRSSRLHDLLRYRYVEALEIKSVCDRLGIGRGEYYRDHRRALAAVCSILGETWALGRATTVAASLPTLRTSFVGRERETAEIKRLLGETRLLTLTGAGGCGKTRLATEVARSLVGAYPNGVWLAQLAPIADPLLVASTVAASLGVRESANEPIAATLTRHLRSWRALVIVDNCEHLLDACAQLAEALLGTCSSLTILATSRQSLGVSGETILRVPSLSSPPKEEGQTREAILQAVLSHEATRLFLDRARSALPSFAATTANGSAIGEICRRLDGIPLAVELAAARVRAFSPEQIASHLDHDFHLLTGGSRTALPRHQTLKATLDWSYALLSDPERVLLRRLAVFVQGFILEAAEGICVGEGIDRLEVVNLLAELVDKSLVEVNATEGDARYHLLEPVRQYAWHRLEESGETEHVQRQHARWLAEYVAIAGDEVFGPGEAQWLRRVAPENDNVRAALDWCLDHDPGLGMALADSTYSYWLTRGIKSERRRWLDELLARDPRPSGAKASVLRSATYEAFHEGDYDRATSLGSEHLAICLRYGEQEAGWPLNVLGIVAAEQGDHERARSLLERAEAIGREHDNAKSLAQTLVWGGYAAWLAGDYRRARLLSEEGLAAYRALGAAFAGLAHWVLGITASSEGDYPSARAHVEAGLEDLRSIWQVLDMSRCLGALGYVSLREGDVEGARKGLSDALRLVPREFKARVSPFLTYLALLANREGDATRAARLAGAAEGIHPCVRNLLAPDQRADLDACLAEAREALGGEGFDRAWAEGRAMTLDQAVEYATTAQGISWQVGPT